MAEDFSAFPEVKREDFSAFPEVKAPARETRPATSTEAQEIRDRELVESASGVVPEAYKAGAYSAWNTALLNIPSYAIARATAVRTGRPFDEVFKEQKEYEEALSRRNPLASGYGTATGLVGGLLLPGGGIAKGAQLAKTAATAKAGSAAGKAAELGTVGAASGALTGASTGFETNFDAEKMAESAVIGAGLGAGLQAAIPAIGRAIGKVKSPIDPVTGAPSAEAQEAVRRALGDKLSPEELEKVMPAILENMKVKGPSEAAATEGYLKKFGIEPTKSMATGVRPSKSAEDVATEGAAVAEGKLTKLVEEKLPSTPPSTSVADSLAKAAQRMNRAGDEAFDAARNIDVQFAHDVQLSFLPRMQERIEASGKIPNILADTAQYPQSAEAYKFIQQISSPSYSVQGVNYNLPFPGDPLNARNVLAIKEKLNSLLRDARGKDAMALKEIRDSFRDTLKDAVDQSLFTGAGREFLDQWTSADKIYGQIKRIYSPDKGAGSEVIRKIIGRMVNDEGKIVGNLAEDAAIAAQGTINSSLLEPSLGRSVYRRLELALGRDSDAMNAIKNNIRTLALGDTSDFARLPAKIDQLLTRNHYIATKVFTPAELSEMKQLSAAIKIIKDSPRSAREQEGDILRLLNRGTSIAAGIIGQAFHGFPGVIMGVGLSEGVGYGARKAAEAYRRSAERAGAPKMRVAPEVLSNAPIRNLEAFEDLSPVNLEGEQYPGYEALPLRTGRATGGKVSHDAISDRLVNMAERAKKEINRDTQVLLKAPDTHVAQALEIANRHIEG